MTLLHSALLASPSPIFCSPRNAHSPQQHAPTLIAKESESLPRWRPQKKRRQFASDRRARGGFAAVAAASSTSSSSSSASSSLAAAASAALARSLYPEIINDPFAALLAEAAGLKEGREEQRQEEQWQLEGETSSSPPPRAAFSAAASAFADSVLLYATDLVNLEADPKGLEYRQVVLLGPGLDTRPQRLGWPAGTVLFECATADAHAVAAAALASERAKELAVAAAEEEGAEAEKEEEEESGEALVEGGVFSSFNGSAAPRGRLLRRVVCDVSTEKGREGLGEALFAAGFRAERLSAWCVSAGAFDCSSSFDSESLGQLFGAVAACAAFCSFVVGDLPPMTRSEAESAIASSGLLGSVVAFGSEGDEAGSALWREKGWRVREGTEGGGGEEEGIPSRWLFVGQQRSRSDAELGILKTFSEAAEDAEGFEDNVS